MKNISYSTLFLCLAFSIKGIAQQAQLSQPGLFNGQRTNLGMNINSEANTDSAPVVSYDGKTMYFKRSVAGASYDYDIYFSTLDNNKQWSKAMPLAELNNDKVSEVEYVYPDGKKMIVGGTFGGKSGLFYATNNNGKWENPEYIELGKELNANDDNLNVTLNSLQNVMILSIHGDIYISFREGRGTWSAVKEITKLNTSGYEYTPFLDYDDKTLYIAGTGYGNNNGEADIFFVERTDNSWMNWSEPQKAKGNINTDGWDSFFYIAPSKDYVYVYSLNEGGGDILRIKRDEPARPELKPGIVDPVRMDSMVVVADVLASDSKTNADSIAVEELQRTNAVNRSMGDNQMELLDALVYPNPTKGIFNLVLHNSNEITSSQVSILDEQLKTITTVATTQNIYNFDISGYDNGIYFVRILCNGKSTVKKVVLQK